MPVVGTAGHVDHGKSTLVLALTGRDPDRWEQEKQRGLTIDLGFAWTVLPDGREISFVDVPGHERYLKNMLAGIEAIDTALLVVAADEGWMLQTEEHLAVLDLLEIGSGVVAVTKADLVDDDLLALAVEEVQDHISGTSLEGAELVPVSAPSGEGVGAIKEALARTIPSSGPDQGRPRLWIDRSFSIPGAGTVVTGTLLGGSLQVGQQVLILPSGATARVRGIQSHEKTHESVDPGRRIALNLSGVEAEAVERGDVVCLDGQWDLTDRFTGRLRAARYVDELSERGAYQIHVGAAAIGVTIDALEDGVALVRSDRKLPLSAGDRFIIRDTGRRLVVAGGVVLDADPGATSRAVDQSKLIDPGSDQIANQLLAIRGSDRIDRLSAHSNGGVATDGIVVGDTVLREEVLADLETRVVKRVEEQHHAHPLRPGVRLASLSSLFNVEAAVVEHVIESSPSLTRMGPDVALVSHSPDLNEKQTQEWDETVEVLRRSQLAVPNSTDLPADPEVIHFKLRLGELVAVEERLLFLPEQIATIRGILGQMDERFTVADFRDAAGLSRRYAVPILEWADREGLTVRRGDYRSAR